MAHIFYSMAGEGRGHAVRVRCLAERLAPEHELTLLASGDAYSFLKPLYPDTHPCVRVESIPGLKFHYRNGRLDLTRSISQGLHYAACELGPLVRRLTRKIEDEQPDLVVTDFEPALPRAALRAGVPFLSLNHQHFLLAYDLSSLPFSLRQYARMMSLAVRLYHQGQAETIVSSFYSPPLKRGYEHVRQIGPLLRRDIEAARPTTGDYLLSYLRRSTPPQVLETLRRAGRPVRVYGLGERSRSGNLEFRAIHEDRFVEDLAGCAGLVSAAGNQLLGEALYLGKPVLALPEGTHHEQLINAHFLKQLGGGQWVTLESFEDRHLDAYLDELESIREALAGRRAQFNGTPSAIAAIEGHLAERGLRKASRRRTGAVS